MLTAAGAVAADGIVPDQPMDRMMMGALGSYPMMREASGTAWQPDSSPPAGVQVMERDWMLMGHALLNGVYDRQQGPRGGTETFLSGMFMGMADRHFTAGDRLQFRAMLSPEPLMGKSGYPLLLATGETADGATPLVDRQHPHDLFMELSGAYSYALTPVDSVFVYAGLPGEPAFGPPAFMHRLTALDSPEAPITHHWLDSTHITDGVATVGAVHDSWKLEASRFNGREPDQFRYRIETGALDSTSARVSWNPGREWSLQASWAELISPEQLEPAKNQSRVSASAVFTHPWGEGAWWSMTAAWGKRRSSGDAALDAYLLEAAWQPPGPWTIFARAERERNDELIVAGPMQGTAFTVGKISIGALRDIRITEHVKVGAGALYALNFVPAPLAPLYGRSRPEGSMAFIRVKIE